MSYSEYVCARRNLTIFAAIVAGIVALAALVSLSVHNNAHVHIGEVRGLAPASGLALLVGFFASIFALVLGFSLSRQRKHAEIIWTLPSSRLKLAVETLLIDAVAIGVAFILTALAVCAVMALFGAWGAIVLDSGFGTYVIVAMGATFLWFALVQLATAGTPVNGGLAAGLSWVAFSVALLLREITFPPLFHQFMSVVNFANPMAYLSFSVDDHRGAAVSQTGNLLLMPIEYQAILVWLLAIAACAGAITMWSRKEV